MPITRTMTTETPEGTATITPPFVFLRSPEATWTRAQWEQLPDDGNRYEVIDGVLYMSTSPSLFHQWISSRVYKALERQLGETDVAFVFYAPAGVFMPGADPVQPDLVVVRAEDRERLRDEHFHGVPALLVEILSPSNAAFDLRTKRAAYARAGVPEYWIVRPTERDLLVLSEPERVSGEYLHAARATPDGELVSPTLPFRAVVADFFAGAWFTVP